MREAIAFVDQSPVQHVHQPQQAIDLQKGDVVYTLTDGMPDQFGGPKSKKFMHKKLKELLISIAKFPMANKKKF